MSHDEILDRTRIAIHVEKKRRGEEKEEKKRKKRRGREEEEEKKRKKRRGRKKEEEKKLYKTVARCVCAGNSTGECLRRKLHQAEDENNGSLLKILASTYRHF